MTDIQRCAFERRLLLDYAGLCWRTEVFKAWESYPEMSKALQELSRDHDALLMFGMNGIPLAIDLAESLAYEGRAATRKGRCLPGCYYHQGDGPLCHAPTCPNREGR